MVPFTLQWCLRVVTLELTVICRYIPIYLLIWSHCVRSKKSEFNSSISVCAQFNYYLRPDFSCDHLREQLCSVLIVGKYIKGRQFLWLLCEIISGRGIRIQETKSHPRICYWRIQAVTFPMTREVEFPHISKRVIYFIYAACHTIW